MKSMTGYAFSQFEYRGVLYNAIIKSYNNRSLDISFKLDRDFYILEPDIRIFMRERISRGRVTISIEQASNNDVDYIDYVINGTQLKYYQDYFDKNGYSALSNDALWLLPGVCIEKKSGSHIMASNWKDIKVFLEDIFAMFDSYREREGQEISYFFKTNIESIMSLLVGISPLIQKAQEKSYEQVYEKIKQFTVEGFEAIKLRSEIVSLISRYDIEEEIQRLSIHLKKLSKMLAIESSVVIGKKLDFIFQEILRETNTALAKSIDNSITELFIQIKNYIEQMREQVQNVE